MFSVPHVYLPLSSHSLRSLLFVSVPLPLFMRPAQVETLILKVTNSLPTRRHCNRFPLFLIKFDLENYSQNPQFYYL